MLFLTDRGRVEGFACDASPRIVVHLDRLSRIDRPYSEIMCDVDLGNLRSLEKLRAALLLYRPDPSQRLVFVIATTDLTAYAVANALGASEIVSQSPFPGAFHVRPSRPVSEPATDTAPPASPPLEVQVGTVVSTLSNMFRATATYDSLSSDLNKGADALLSAIKQASIQDWISIVRGYDDATYQHCLLVAGLVAAFSARLGLAFKSQHLLSQAALVHDIGKARVPHAILNKAGVLSIEEQKVMRRHPSDGYYMIGYQKGVDPNIRDIVRHHHEYLDGSGYPDRLRADRISELCRIVTICDIYGALLERRPYKPPMAPREAYAVLVEMGPKLDARLVGDFGALVEDMCASEVLAA